MSLMNQLFRQVIKQDLPEDVYDILWPLLFVARFPDKRLREDIQMLWYQDECDEVYEGGAVLEACLTRVEDVETYGDHYDLYQHERRRFKPLRDRGEKNNIQASTEEWIMGGYDPIISLRYAEEKWRKLLAIDVINIIRRMRDGILYFTIEEDDGRLHDHLNTYGMDCTTCTIYKTKYKENYTDTPEPPVFCESWAQIANDFFDKYMYQESTPYMAQHECIKKNSNNPNNSCGFIWLQSYESDVYGKLMLKPDGWMNDDFMNGEQPEYHLDY
jgi:hypothetical protein